ncbi:DNA helicase [Cellulomonas hominis]|uniref:DNA helicase n=1 Tax=Cellulomonas hominis TaxID=156981 RepID=A0A511F853_9CELL|nr:DEAD/DEAH box helicase [Cellulomonas hominis]MBB5473161.1 superfamily II DNA or RNA helicase [Cellulomonas hominis]GEL45410.1 DNA helicase [Cellulomonas hominis]
MPADPATPAAPAAPASPTGPAAPAPWREVVDGLLAWGGAGEARGVERAGRAALQLEVRELTPRTRDRWNGPTSRTAGARRAADDLVRGSGEHRLAARPVLRTGRGWARGGATWSNLPHLQSRLDLDDDQHRWFCQLGALHRAARPAQPGDDPGWLFLDDFANPVLWELLDQARGLGVPLVGSGAGARVRLAGRAVLGLDAAGTDDGGIRLAARLTVDDEPVPVGDAHPIGTHGLWVADLARPRDVLLAPTAAPLTPHHLALLGAPGGRTVADALGAGVVVPAEGAGEFLREHLPALRAGLDVGSADGSVDLPPPAPPTLVLTVTHAPGHVLDLAWRWDGHRGSAPAPDPRTLLPRGLLPATWWPEDAAPGDAALPRPVTLRDVEAAEFATTALPRLAGRRGVRVDTVGTPPAYRELQGTPVLAVTAQPSEQHDWFDLGVTVTVDGRTVPFVPLFSALAKGRRRLLLVDGSYLSLDHPALEPLADLIAEARDLAEWETGLRISRHQTSLWSDLADLADEAETPEPWRALLADAAAPAPVPVPRGLRADLRPYQVEGFRWLAALWRHGLGGVLADDMGLGKTVQTLALVQHAAEQRADGSPRRPFLVVAPTSVVPNWVAEAARFTPGLVVRRVEQTDAAGPTPLADLAAGADVVVTSYALLRLDAAAYRAVGDDVGWAGLVLDEAQQVKNAASRGHEAARDLAVPFTLAVTGTPVENSLTELHALLALTTPGLLPSARRFGDRYVRPIEGAATGISSGPGAGEVPADRERVRAERLATLRRRIRPFLLRRTKDLVAADLPAKQEQTLAVELAPEHRAVYDRYLQLERQKVLGLVDDLDRQRFIVYRSLTLLRMLALDPRLIDPGLAGIPAAKADALLEQIADVVAEGHRALVFSQFTSYLALVAERLTAAGVEFAYLDGSTTRRADVIDGFREGDAPVFLLSLKAGGTGLNLTEADYVFLLDPWWNPAAEQQAVDRAHRIGQHRHVMVYRLIAAGTIEEKVVALQARKAALVDAVIDDGDLFGSALTADEVRDLLA